MKLNAKLQKCWSKGLYSEEYQCLLVTGLIAQEEGQHLALLRRLSPPQRNHFQREIPVLIIDELLDELSGARYFTSLDL